ncbi:MAG: hypothetical protein JRJ29_11160, partial [Deltaproteobacteria bacterium]|nr:hypothetical protein [Deltaproteobacteria bacterium]
LGASVLGFFLLLQLVILPFFEQRERIRRGIEVKEKGLEEILKLRQEYRLYKRSNRTLEQFLRRRARNFTLFSYLERAASKTDVKRHIKYMRPSTSDMAGPYRESVVEMKLEGITLGKLVEYLYRIENPVDVVSVRRISIREDKNEPGYLDVVMQVLTFLPGEDAKGGAKRVRRAG